MSTQVQFNAELREGQGGKAVSRRLRRLQDRIPAVIYGAGKDNQCVTLPHKDVMLNLAHEAVYSQILTLNVGSTQEKVVLKAVQRHPIKKRILHVDFMRVNMKEKLKMHVPLHFMGENENVALKEGAIVSHLMNELEVRCLPGDLPEYIEVDMSNLGLDESIHLSQVHFPNGVELAHAADEAHDHTVVSIHLPRAAKEDTEEAATAETAEGAAAPAAETPAENKE